jgi:hypothetical protein
VQQRQRRILLQLMVAPLVQMCGVRGERGGTRSPVCMRGGRLGSSLLRRAGGQGGHRQRQRPVLCTCVWTWMDEVRKCRFREELFGPDPLDPNNVTPLRLHSVRLTHRYGRGRPQNRGPRGRAGEEEPGSGLGDSAADCCCCCCPCCRRRGDDGDDGDAGPAASAPVPRRASCWTCLERPP